MLECKNVKIRIAKAIAIIQLVTIERSGPYQSCSGSSIMRTLKLLLILHFLTGEVPTVLPLRTCGPTEATCSNGECIDKSRVCDGQYDCSDRSDEIRCTKPSKFAFKKCELISKLFFFKDGCEPNQFQCDNGKCILKTWMCDSDDDCLDGSDERNCGTNEWNCSSGNQAIPKSFHCDGEVDCTDLSDEIGCSEFF